MPDSESLKDHHGGVLSKELEIDKLKTELLGAENSKSPTARPAAGLVAAARTRARQAPRSDSRRAKGLQKVAHRARLGDSL